MNIGGEGWLFLFINKLQPKIIYICLDTGSVHRFYNRAKFSDQARFCFAVYDFVSQFMLMINNNRRSLVLIIN